MKKIRIEMQDGGVMIAELYEDVAPLTVDNFLSLANKGFYDGLTFHRVIPGFMIQGEFSANGVKNDLKHTTGVLSMARAAQPDSAGSQFFIMHADAPHLDGQYAAFGKVIEGLEVVDRIASVRTDYADKPLTPVVISSIREITG